MNETNCYFRGCKLTISCNQKTVNDYAVKKFVLAYLSCWLADYMMIDIKNQSKVFTYTNHIIEKKKDINVFVSESNSKMQISVNKSRHIEFDLYRFHSIQLIAECEHNIHSSFFHNLHHEKVDGKDIFGYV